MDYSSPVFIEENHINQTAQIVHIKGKIRKREVTTNPIANH